MRHNGVLSLTLGLSAALLLFACSNSSSPTDPGANQAYHFDPVPGAVSIDALDTFKVKITRKDGTPALGVFYLDEDSVATGSSFAWRADRIGQVEIKVVLPPVDAPIVARWMLTVSDANTSPPAPVALMQASRGALPGSIATSWVRPGTGTELIHHYRLFYSTAPITEDNLEGLDFASVAQDSTIIVQSHLLTDLIEKTQYYMRVQVVDILGRRSTLSRESTSLSTGHYKVEGRVTRLKDGGGVEGFPEVLAQVGQYQALSGSDGRYVIGDIPDLSRHRLTLKPTRPLEAYSYYWVVSDSLELQDQEFDALLFKPLPQVFITSPRDTFINSLDFLYIMASKVKDGASPPILRRWESYPIPVRVDADSASTIAGQSVTTAMQTAIQTWNDEAGEELLTTGGGQAGVRGGFQCLREWAVRRGDTRRGEDGGSP